MSLADPSFPGWSEGHNKTYVREDGNGNRAVVGRLDGWNWGYLILDADGLALAGRMTSAMDVFAAIDQAEKAIANRG